MRCHDTLFRDKRIVVMGLGRFGGGVDAAIYAAGRPPVLGKPAIREYITKARSNPGSSIDWTTDEAVVGHLGYLGYTRGPYELKIPGADGKLTTERGHYICIWRSQADVWRC
ncbi:MAG: hypothetical protein IIC50_21590, partial [Planctomycetes bacterium]|nr:hypothetical protein [Planctomycetota bacterium]